MGNHFPKVTQLVGGQLASRTSLLTPNYAPSNYKGKIFLTYNPSLVMRIESHLLGQEKSGRLISSPLYWLFH